MSWLPLSPNGFFFCHVCFQFFMSAFAVSVRTFGVQNVFFWFELIWIHKQGHKIYSDSFSRLLSLWRRWHNEIKILNLCEPSLTHKSSELSEVSWTTHQVVLESLQIRLWCLQVAVLRCRRATHTHILLRSVLNLLKDDSKDNGCDDKLTCDRLHIGFDL